MLPSEPVPGRPHVRIQRTGAAVIATLLDKRVLGLRAQKLFENDLFPLADSLAGNGLVIDFSPVRYFGSDSFGRLVELASRVKAGQGWLRLCSIDPLLREVIRVTRLDSRLDIHPDLESALDCTRPTDPG